MNKRPRDTTQALNKASYPLMSDLGSGTNSPFYQNIVYPNSEAHLTGSLGNQSLVSHICRSSFYLLTRIMVRNWCYIVPCIKSIHEIVYIQWKSVGFYILHETHIFIWLNSHQVSWETHSLCHGESLRSQLMTFLTCTNIPYNEC